MSSPARRLVRPALLAGAAGAWAWWDSGQAPFRPLATAAVALPVALVLGLAVRRRARTPAPVPVRGRLAPWSALLAAAAALEGVALATGSLPTLSRVLDDALIAPRATRAATALAWCAAGAALLGTGWPGAPG